MAVSPNQIAALISAWFVATPKGLFGNVDADGKVIQDPAVIKWLDTAIAICLAESGGDANAKNADSSASGLWQIMYSLHAGKSDTAQKAVQAKTGEDNLNVFDPRVNTMIAGMIYANAGQKWTPWEAYNTGAYKQYQGKGLAAFMWLNNEAHLKAGKDSLATESVEGTNADVEKDGGLLGLMQQIDPDFARALNNPLSSGIPQVLSFVRSGAMTVGVFLLALVALILGVAFVVSSTSAGKRIAKATPIGKVVT